MQRLPMTEPGIDILIQLIGALAAVMAVASLVAAQSAPFPTYQLGANLKETHGPNYPSDLLNPWVVSSGQIITPAGSQVYLGIRTRAKAIALNPTGNHTAAVLQMGPQAVTVFDTKSGVVLQNYLPFGSTSGTSNGIAYTSDGKYLLFSQDEGYVTVAAVDPVTGLLSDHTHVSVPIDATPLIVPGYGWVDILNTVTSFPNSPPGTSGDSPIPSGIPVSQGTSYPLGIAISPDNTTAYVVLDANNTLGRIDLTKPTPVETADIRVGNVPHSVVISPDGLTAYVSNEAGRIAQADDFQQYSNGTPVVAQFPTGATASGTISVVDLKSFTVTGTIQTGLHPTGMAIWDKCLLVANAYDDTISVVDRISNKVVRTIDVGLPIGVPQQGQAFGATPNSIAVDTVSDIAYAALYTANAVAVIDLKANHLKGLIPVGYAPSSVVLDVPDNVLLVANDKGLGSTGYGAQPAPTNTAENSYAKSNGVFGLNTHQDLGTVSIVPIPDRVSLAKMTLQVAQNNHWDLLQNIQTAAGGKETSEPVAIPKNIGDPSKIKHVFVIIRENRSYDQILGDVVGGNGDSTLAVFGDNSGFGHVTPNAHALVRRFPLLDNFYDPSRQSADGHNWILQAMAPYSDDIQSPDWVRDYPSNGGDALAYQQKGFLWDVAAAAGVTVKNYGEFLEYNTFLTPGGGSIEPTWTDFYKDALAYESGAESQLYYYNTISSYTSLPNLFKATVQNYPLFDLGIPDQFRVDIWAQDFARDVAKGTLPKLEFIWISSDHTGGPPTAKAMQADNDLAVGRFVDIISHSSVWSTSAIFIEEDDAQSGVDHVDGHRSPAYVISPFVKQRVNPVDGSGTGITEDGTFYTQVNMTRTIEQILGLSPMNQFDLVASPMRTIFIDNPPSVNFLPWSHVANGIPLDSGVQSEPRIASRPSSKTGALAVAWLKKKEEIFAGKYHIPDCEDPDAVNHLDWYEATGFELPYPGEQTVRPPSEFNKRPPVTSDDDN